MSACACFECFPSAPLTGIQLPLVISAQPVRSLWFSCLRLLVWRCVMERVDLTKRRIDAEDVWKLGEVDLRVASRVSDLRDKHDIGKRDSLANAEASAG